MFTYVLFTSQRRRSRRRPSRAARMMQDEGTPSVCGQLRQRAACPGTSSWIVGGGDRSGREARALPSLAAGVRSVGLGVARHRRGSRLLLGVAARNWQWSRRRRGASTARCFGRRLLCSVWWLSAPPQQNDCTSVSRITAFDDATQQQQRTLSVRSFPQQREYATPISNGKKYA